MWRTMLLRCWITCMCRMCVSFNFVRAWRKSKPAAQTINFLSSLFVTRDTPRRRGEENNNSNVFGMLCCGVWRVWRTWMSFSAQNVHERERGAGTHERTRTAKRSSGYRPDTPDAPDVCRRVQEWDGEDGVDGNRVTRRINMWRDKNQMDLCNATDETDFYFCFFGFLGKILVFWVKN